MSKVGFLWERLLAANNGNAGGGKPRPYKISPFCKGGHRGIFDLAGTEAGLF